MLLGLEAPEDELGRAFARRRQEPHGEGLCGRPHDFQRAPRGAGCKGEIDADEAAVADMAARFQRLVDAWQRAVGLG